MSQYDHKLKQRLRQQLQAVLERRAGRLCVLAVDTGLLMLYTGLKSIH
jgi:hypothetical protein